MRTETLSLIAGVGLVGGLGYLLARHVSRGALVDLRTTPTAATLPAGTPTTILPTVMGPARLSEPFGVVPGGRYVAAVDVSFPLSVGASAIDVANEARGLGFADATASRTRPTNPPIAGGDYYVIGTYSGAPRSFSRSNAKGLVTVRDVWRIA
jgi:hypothetical protein